MRWLLAGLPKHMQSLLGQSLHALEIKRTFPHLLVMITDPSKVKSARDTPLGARGPTPRLKAATQGLSGFLQVLKAAAILIFIVALIRWFAA